MKNAVYIEPDNFFPEEIRRKHKIGEFAEDEPEEKPKKKGKKTKDQEVKEAMDIKE